MTRYRGNEDSQRLTPITYTTQTRNVQGCNGGRYGSFKCSTRSERCSDSEEYTCDTADTTLTDSPTCSVPESAVEQPRGEDSPPIKRDRRMSEDSECSTNAFVGDLEYQNLPHLSPTYEVSKAVAAKWVAGQSEPSSFQKERSTKRRVSTFRYGWSRWRFRNSHPTSTHMHPVNPDMTKGGIRQKYAADPAIGGTTMAPPSASEDPAAWNTSSDPKSGRVYYYNEITRETQWRKPLCCATEAEKEEAARQERQTKDFFAAMEANIRKSMTSGEQLPEIDSQTEIVDDAAESLSTSDEIDRPDLVRTISTLENSVLADLIQKVPSHRLLRDTNEDSTRFLDSVVGSQSICPFDQVSSIQQPEYGTRNNQRNLVHRMRGNSSLRGSITRISLDSDRRMNFVPEGENEDASSSHNEPGEVSRVLERSQGTISLKYSHDEDSEDDATWAERRKTPIEKMQVRFQCDGGAIPYLSDNTADSFRASWLEGGTDSSLGHMNIPVSRENSFTLQALTTSDRSLQGCGSVSQFNQGFRRQESAEWDRFSLNSTGEDVMSTLALISHEMAAIDPDSSTSSLQEPLHTSLDGLSIASGDSSDMSDGEDSLRRRNKLNRPQSMRESPSKQAQEKPKRNMQRRNTCGTIYVGSTMAAPDIEATIKCICGVFRAHVLLSSETASNKNTSQHHFFNDLEVHRKPGAVGLESTPVPSLEEVSSFYRDIFGRTKMEPDCIIISLIYVERLIKATNGSLRPRACNWRSVLFSCMVLSSKVWDDMSMWNSDFTQTCPPGMALTLQRVNDLEVTVLGALSYRVKVPASEYAKYYFLLRSMLLKSGLGSEDLNTMNPLDVEGARQLQYASSAFQSNASRKIKSKVKRAQTAGTSTNGDGAQHQQPRVGLEHLVQL